MTESMTQNAEQVLSNDVLQTIAPGAVAFKTNRLHGGVSADTIAVVATHEDGSIERYVVRHRPVVPEEGQVTVAVEHALLEILHAEGMSVACPRILLSSDMMVMDWVDGSTNLPVDGHLLMAQALRAIHEHGGKSLCLLPPREDPLPIIHRVFAEFNPGVCDAVFSVLDSSEYCLLHGDFWPGNLMWCDGKLAAILDWEDAAIGDPLSDVACARVELAVACGEQASLAFVSAYFKGTKYREKDLALWEVYVATTALASMDSWGLSSDDLTHRRGVTQLCRERAIMQFQK